VEPVIGQIKEARGLRRFMKPIIEKGNGEWHLIAARNPQPAQVIRVPTITAAVSGRSNWMRGNGIKKNDQA